MKYLWRSKPRALWDRLCGWLALIAVGVGAACGLLWLLFACAEWFMPHWFSFLHWCGAHIWLIVLVLVAACGVGMWFDGRSEQKTGRAA